MKSKMKLEIVNDTDDIHIPLQFAAGAEFDSQGRQCKSGSSELSGAEFDSQGRQGKSGSFNVSSISSKNQHSLSFEIFIELQEQHRQRIMKKNQHR